MKKMKKKILITLAIIFSIFLILGLCVFLLIQEEKYTSKEEKEYYENLSNNFTFFEPLDTAFILRFQSENYEIKESELNFEPYSSNKFWTPYADSIYAIKFSVDNWQNEVEVEKIGKIEKTDILKYEKKDSIEAFIYENSVFEDEQMGIWIAYSENNGKDWNYYYTGITQREPVFVKFYSQRPLIKEKNKLEIDACLLRQISVGIHPGPGPSYECVKNGIYLIFDMNIIAKDSDGDGLTDIVEDKFYTDKYNKDTDGDGIPDNLDMNSRVHYPRTKKSIMYEAIINEDIGDWVVGRLTFRGSNTIHHFTDSIETVDYIPTDKKNFIGIQQKEKVSFMTPTETVLIVTDDKDLMGIQPQKYRIIFITTEEYKSKATAYNSELNRMYLSPLFKVDNKRNTYVISYDFNTWGSKYLIQKTIIGWRIKLLSSWIS